MQFQPTITLTPQKMSEIKRGLLTLQTGQWVLIPGTHVKARWISYRGGFQIEHPRGEWGRDGVSMEGFKRRASIERQRKATEPLSWRKRASRTFNPIRGLEALIA